MEEIDRDGIEPLHVQLANILRIKIESGEFAPGARLPTSMALEDEHHLARATVQKALNTLKAEGLIVGVVGRGVFVKPEASADE